MFPELKPYLTALAMPSASLILLILLGSILINKNAKLARRLILSPTAALWLLSTNGFAVWFHDTVIPPYPPVSAQVLKDNSIQAVVVLGGGVITGLPGGDQQLSKTSLERLRLGAQLSRQSGIPLVFSGGSGWGAKETNVSEAEVAEAVLLNAFGMPLNFKESLSRDTQENADNTWKLLSKNGITRIALVTHTTHMPRASMEFQRVGFNVTEASVGQPTASNATGLRWMPSPSNLEWSQAVLREILASQIKGPNSQKAPAMN